MKQIKEYRISLMQKEGKALKKNKQKYVIKCSVTFDVARALEQFPMDHDSFVVDSAHTVFEELQESNKDVVESVGVWFKFMDGEEIDNSIDLVVLDDIKKYGVEDIEPMKEFIKMTLGYESENG